MTTDLYAMGMRARNAIYACFFFLGFLGLAWIPRIPEIKTTLNLSDGQFGLVLLASTVGSIPGAQLAGRMVHMYSSNATAIAHKIGDACPPIIAPRDC